MGDNKLNVALNLSLFCVVRQSLTFWQRLGEMRREPGPKGHVKGWLFSCVNGTVGENTSMRVY